MEDAAEDYARKLRQVGPRTGRKAVKDCSRDDCLGTQTVTMAGDLGWSLTSQGHSSADLRLLSTKMGNKPPDWISQVW